MKSKIIILITLLSTIIFSAPNNYGENETVIEAELVDQLVMIVTSIIQGKDYTEFRENISPEAYVICDNSYESIFEVLSNPIKKEKFIEREETKTGILRMWIPEQQNEAYMILETKSDDNMTTNWHSIIFKIGKNQKWQILNWHKS